MSRCIKVQEEFAVVDDEYYEILKDYTWWLIRRDHSFYAATTVNGKNIRMHHMIVGRPLNGLVTDHIDGNGLNNRKENLRIVTQRENAINLKIDKTSRFPGVSWQKFRKKWVAQMRIGKRSKFLGHFVKEEDAAMAYKKAIASNIYASGGIDGTE